MQWVSELIPFKPNTGLVESGETDIRQYHVGWINAYPFLATSDSS